MTIVQRKIQIDETIMGPAFFIFFRVKTIVIPPSNHGGSSSLAVVADDELDTIEVEDQADLDNKDLSDILTLLKMAEIIE